MGHDRITAGGYVFEDGDIVSGNCYIGSSVAGDELAIDTLTVSVQTSDHSIKSIPYGTPVLYHYDGVLVGKFYKEKIERISKLVYELRSVSGIGLLEGGTDHYGGLYTGQTASVVLKEIIGSIVEYSVASQVAKAKVYGWLPIASRRDNLRQLLFAVGASVRKTRAGTIDIVFLDADEPVIISDDRLGFGGTIEYPGEVSGVVALEHSYLSFPTDEEATLYDDAVQGEGITTPKGLQVTGALVKFTEPYHDLTASGGRILESGANYAVLSQGSRVTLKGKRYTHTVREVYASIDGRLGAERVARIDNATLLNLTNSEAVAKRIADYYAHARVISNDLIVGAERPGQAVAFHDPFDDPVSGILSSLDINLGNLLVARARLTAGYLPDGGGSTYDRLQVLTGSGSWTVPAGVKSVRVVCISGGNGGQGGYNGRDAVAPDTYYHENVGF